MVLRKKYYAFMVLVAVLGLAPFASAVRSEEIYVNLQENSWKFITDVLMLDVAKYEFSLKMLEAPTHLGAPPQWVHVDYRFRAGGSKLDVSFLFKNGSFSSCTVYLLEGAPIFAKEMPENVLERAKAMLERYQKCFGKRHIGQMLKMLNAVADLRNMTKIEGNIKFWIQTEPIKAANSVLTYIYWEYVENGIVFRQKSVGFIFSPTTWTFVDPWEIYRVGSAELKVSREGAVQIAKEAVKTYTYTAADYEGKTVVVGNFTVLEKPLYVELGTDYRGKDYYTLYPFWEVYLCLDRMYLGGVTGLRVFIWADMGEVISITPTGSLGPPPIEIPPTKGEEATPNPPTDGTETTPQQEDSKTQTPNVYIIAIVAATIITIPIVIVAVKKRRMTHKLSLFYLSENRNLTNTTSYQ